MNSDYKVANIIKRRQGILQNKFKSCFNCKREELDAMEYPCDDCLATGRFIAWEAREDDVKM